MGSPTFQQKVVDTGTGGLEEEEDEEDKEWLLNRNKRQLLNHHRRQDKAAYHHIRLVDIRRSRPCGPNSLFTLWGAFVRTLVQ